MGWEADHASSLGGFLAELDAAAYLADAGVAPADVTALRARLVDT